MNLWMWYGLYWTKIFLGIIWWIYGLDTFVIAPGSICGGGESFTSTLVVNFIDSLKLSFKRRIIFLGQKLNSVLGKIWIRIFLTIFFAYMLTKHIDSMLLSLRETAMNLMTYLKSLDHAASLLRRYYTASLLHRYYTASRHCHYYTASRHCHNYTASLFRHCHYYTASLLRRYYTVSSGRSGYFTRTLGCQILVL